MSVSERVIAKIIAKEILTKRVSSSRAQPSGESPVTLKTQIKSGKRMGDVVWKPPTIYMMKCSLCKHQWETTIRVPNWNKCPMCGDRKFWGALIHRMVGLRKKLVWGGHSGAIIGEKHI